jgi:hypothetical protein
MDRRTLVTLSLAGLVIGGAYTRQPATMNHDLSEIGTGVKGGIGFVVHTIEADFGQKPTPLGLGREGATSSPAALPKLPLGQPAVMGPEDVSGHAIGG